LRRPSWLFRFSSCCSPGCRCARSTRTQNARTRRSGKWTLSS
jgi:hypothetical protein